MWWKKEKGGEGGSDANLMSDNSINILSSAGLASRCGKEPFRKESRSKNEGLRSGGKGRDLKIEARFGIDGL